MKASIETGRLRARIENVAPQIDGGDFPVKRTVGQRVLVTADVLSDGHEQLSCLLKYHSQTETRWHEVPMGSLGNDRWDGEFLAAEVGRYCYTIEAWVDHFKSWREQLQKRVDAAQDVCLELQIGANLVRDAANRAPQRDAE
jgi:starch synthase (maltosyl-transferring)